jgi:hypothetical protein
MEHTVDKQTMDSLKALADVNIKVSEARSLLSTLQAEETEYLEAREKRALGRIQKVHDESAMLIKQTGDNYEDVHTLCVSVTELAGFITEAYGKFASLKETFDDRAVAWEAHIKEKESEVAALLKLAEADRVKLANETKAVARTKVLIAQDKRKLDDERATLERAIKRLKEGRL